MSSFSSAVKLGLKNAPIHSEIELFLFVKKGLISRRIKENGNFSAKVNINSILVQLILLELEASAYTVLVKINLCCFWCNKLIYLSILSAARKVISGYSVP